MRIVLLTTAYPPASTDGIPRQRQALAAELARRGHAVDVITLGAERRQEDLGGVRVHTFPTPAANHFSDRYPSLDLLLTYSQALYEGLAGLAGAEPVSIVDVPLWAAQGLVSLRLHRGPVVVWLQTSAAQLLRINDRPAASADRAVVALEQLCLERAPAILADSTVALEAACQAGGPRLTTLRAVAPLGLPPPTVEPAPRPSSGPVQVLLVGRLERRKGTPQLLEHLPGWLARHPALMVRFAGRDNSANDGWLQERGLDYPSYFRQQHPGLAGRVIFEGYVGEARLAESYAQADVVLVPSLYESFGLVYLEAMRAGRPVVTFAAGAAPEIFAEGEAHGALLAPPGDWTGMADALGSLLEQPARRAEMGRQGYLRFMQAFTAATMGEVTLAFYERVLGQGRPASTATRQIFQVMEALDEGDAVSRITRRNAALLAELGQPRPIVARYAVPKLRSEIQSIDQALPPGSGLIFHYWGYNTSTGLLASVQGRKALHFHNITPPGYFPPDTEAYRSTAQGYGQLRQLPEAFELLVGDSLFDLQCLQPYLTTPKPACVLPPIVDAGELRAAPYDTARYAALREPGQINFLFAGRVARNKRQELVMRVFDHYYREINRHARLWLVGNTGADPAYLAELEELRARLPSGPHIALTGKLPEPELFACFRAADIFLCASEHEGFCLPLIEAMAFDLPVLAFAAAAVPETMGGQGFLIRDWDVPRLAELAHLVLSDSALRERIVAGQRTNLSRFSTETVQPRLEAIVHFLLSGEVAGENFIRLEPKAAPADRPIPVSGPAGQRRPRPAPVKRAQRDLAPALQQADQTVGFFSAFGDEPLGQFFARTRPVSVRSEELRWIDEPEPDFVQYVINRRPFPFEVVQTDPSAFKGDPTYMLSRRALASDGALPDSSPFMISQVHRLWLTLRAIRAHLPDEANTILDLGAFPFSLDVILREYAGHTGPIHATVNLPMQAAWQAELDQRAIQVHPLNLDSFVQSPDAFERGLPTILALPDASVDLVIFAHVIEHLYHPLKILLEAQRVLKPGGKILITTDNAFMLDALLHIGTQQEYLHEPITGTAAMTFHFWRGHCRYFTAGDLKQLVLGSGLQPIETRFCEVLYNSFAADYFENMIVSFPQWKAQLLTRAPAYRNEVMLVGVKPQ